jgi:hypothetical protein
VLDDVWPTKHRLLAKRGFAMCTLRLGASPDGAQLADDPAGLVVFRRAAVTSRRLYASRARERHLSGPMVWPARDAKPLPSRARRVVGSRSTEEPLSSMKLLWPERAPGGERITC